MPRADPRDAWIHVDGRSIGDMPSGSLIGTKLAMRHGSGFVRRVFLVVVTILIVKTSWDAWQRW